MRALLALSPLLLAAAQATTQRHDSDAPVNFGADHIELADKANRATLTGNVVVTQAEMTLTSARMTIAYTGTVSGGHPEAQRVDAQGDVVVKRPDQTATSRFAIYDVPRHVITMLGGVVLHQGTNVVNGSRLTLNTDTGRAVVDGSAVASSGPAGVASPAPGGRVTGTFSVPKRDDQPAASATPAAK